MLNIVIWIAVGVVLGLAASWLTHLRKPINWLINVAAGALGAVVIGVFVSPYLGTPQGNEGVFSFGALVVATVGALGVLLLVHVVRRGEKP